MNMVMQEKLLHSYTEKALGKKTLIFNNGINTSLYVLDTFKEAGYVIKHLDNTTSPEDRRDILTWFKNTPDAILTSVGILTTGFDEPTVDCIILNRATKSLTLYFQMIGRGSRKLPNKNEFTIIDLGNNALRFGLWNETVDWQHIFKYPENYLESIRDDAEIERNFNYQMPEVVRNKFKKTKDILFDVEDEFQKTATQNLRSKLVLEKSIFQHANMCIDNSTSLLEARMLSKLLSDDIESRVKQFINLLGKTSKNYREWLIEDYKQKLAIEIGRLFREKNI